MKEDIRKYEKNYTKYELNETDTPANPIELFEKWFQQTLQIEALPSAFTLATATKKGIPSARTLYLKKYDESGLYFYSNYEKPKRQRN